MFFQCVIGRPLFHLFSFYSSNKKIVDFSRIQIHIVGVEGKQADPLNHHPGPDYKNVSCSPSLSLTAKPLTSQDYLFQKHLQRQRFLLKSRSALISYQQIPISLMLCYYLPTYLALFERKSVLRDRICISPFTAIHIFVAALFMMDGHSFVKSFRPQRPIFHWSPLSLSLQHAFA